MPSSGQAPMADSQLNRDGQPDKGDLSNMVLLDVISKNNDSVYLIKTLFMVAIYKSVKINNASTLTMARWRLFGDCRVSSCLVCS